MSIVEELRKDPENGARRLEGEYKAGLMTLARRFCPDEGDAEELVNRTFAAVVAGIDDYVEQSAFFAWMCQILSHLHSMDVRRKSRRNEVADPDAGEAPDEGAAERLFESVDAALLREAIDALPKDMKQVLVMHYLMDLPLARIGKFLALPVGTVKWRLHCARSELGRRLGAQRPGVRMLVLALLLAAGLAIGGGLYALGTAALFQSHAENAESAEVVSHSENAESAEVVSRAESAEPASPTISTSSTASTASTPEPSAMKTSLLAVASLSLFATSSPAASSYPLDGGTRTFVVGDVVNTFTESGTLVVHEETTVRALFVAGGGGGGGGVGGGGGGGGVVAIDELLLEPGTYVVTVGAGGAGGTPTKVGTNGGDTTMSNANAVAVSPLLPAVGGGRGGAWNYQGGLSAGGSGGASCGGRAGAAGTPGQGYAGGLSYARSSGGGGGAGGPGGDGGNNAPRSPSAVGGVGVTNDISGVAIAYGGGGGGGGGDGGATPASPGTDGGGDGTGYNSGLPGGDGEDGRGGGGGGSGWQNTKDGGRGGSGVVILRYTFDASRLATPTITAKSVSPGVKSASVALDVVSFGRDASSVSIVATARPAGGGEPVARTFENVPAGVSTLALPGLESDVDYEIWLVATNDRGQSSAPVFAGSAAPVGAAVVATGGEEFQWNLRRRIHVFTNATDVLVVEKSGFADVLLVGGGGAGGTGVGGGGGGGGGWGPTAGNPGGCGGGSCGGFEGAAGTPGQGYDGGQSYSRSSSGGGGAGGPGGDGGNNTPRAPSAVGGIGFACSITGVEVRYGGGGGGGGGDNGATPGSPGTDGGGDGTAFNFVLPGGDGADGLGAGGGGSGFGTAGTARGGYGGCGTVIVAYDLPPAGTMILVK